MAVKGVTGGGYFSWHWGVGGIGRFCVIGSVECGLMVCLCALGGGGGWASGLPLQTPPPTHTNVGPPTVLLNEKTAAKGCIYHQVQMWV